MDLKLFTQRSLMPLGLLVAFLVLPLRGFADLSNLISDASMFYDIDGDGKKEWCVNGSIYRLNDNYSDVEKVASLSYIGNPEGYFISDGVFFYYEKEYKGDQFVLNIVKISKDFKDELIYQWDPVEDFNFADLDNNGKIKIFTNPYSDIRNGNIGIIQGDEFIYSTVEFMTPEDAAGEIKELNNSSYRNPLDNSVWLPVGNSRGQYYNHFQSIDLNSDGLMDYIAPSLGAYYENIGTDRLVVGNYGGRITTRDFNGDGLYDFLVFNPQEKKVSVYISSPAGGEAKEQVLLKDLYCSENIFCYDFDKDGDIDILIPIDYFYKDGNYAESNGGSYLVMMENDGTGKFKMHETYLEGQLRFIDCKDLDGSGNYDVLAIRQYKILGSYDNPKSDIIYFSLNGLEIKTEPTIIEKDILLYGSQYSERSYDNYNVCVINPDNSGKNVLIYETNDFSVKSIKLYSFPKIKEFPSAPAKPTYHYDASNGALNVSWKPATDKNISSADLTYEIRVGTSQDKGDVFFAKSLADGSRLVSEIGNSGYALNRVLNTSSWPSGKYYISVQAIDQNGNGSRFSDYAIFDKKTPAADFFFVAENDSKNTEGIITVKLNHAIENSTEYIWDWNNAKVVDKSSDGTEYKIKFTKEGVNPVSMYAKTSSNIKSPSKTLSISIAKGAIEDGTIVTEEGESGTTVYAALDLDEDGIEEVLFPDSKFYEYTGNGTYSTVKKIFNTNLNFGANTKVLDFNKDGRADLISAGRDEVNLLLNDGDKAMTRDNLDLNEVDIALVNYDDYSFRFNFSTDYPFYDFDNDGNVDYFNGRIFYSDGSLLKYDSYEYEIGGYVYDYNGDGLLDLLGFRYAGGNNIFEILINNGDRTFTKLEEYPYHPDIVSIANHRVIKLDNINNTGKPDFITTEYSSGYGVSFFAENVEIYGADGSKTLIPHYQDILYGAVLDIFDFDNNGTKDILVETWAPDAFKEGSGAYGKMIIYMFPGGQYSYSPIESDNYSGYYSRFFLGDGSLSVSGIRARNVNNTKPTAPTNLRASREGDFLVIEWNHSQDVETPEKGMQYNLSIKHKGKEGEGAYFISPLNSDKNGVHIPSGKPLLTSNKFSIPVSNIPEGEYEVRVQGVDAWWQESDFSDMYVLKVDPSSYIDMPTSTMVGCEIEVKFVGESAGKENSFGEGAEVKNTEAGLKVSWNTPGEKTITAGKDYSASIYVYPAPEGDFVFPSKILAGASVNIEAQNTLNTDWEVSVNNSEFMSLTDNGEFELRYDKEGNLSAVFYVEGDVKLRHKVKESYGEAVYEHSAIVTSENCRPEILKISLDEKANSYNILWSDVAPPEATSINIYKQGAKIDDYRLLATLPISDRNFVDDASQPDATAARYRLTYGLSYGESAPGLTYQTIYAKINKPSEGSWNISWSPYEGMEVRNYRILRGSNPGNLEMISEVGGESLSYKDTDPGNSTLYYAVEALTNDDLTRTADSSTRSNIVSTDEAIDAILATSIELALQSEDSVLGDLNPKVEIGAYIYPLNATFKDVNWEIISGKDLAAIDQYGRVTVAPERMDGSVVVRASTIDGSEIYEEIELNVEKNKTTIVLKDLPLVTYGDPEIDLFNYAEKGVDIVYTSSDPEIAQVEGTILTIKNAGEVIIRAESNDNSFILKNSERSLIIEKADLIVSVKEVIAYTGYGFDGFEFYAEGLKYDDTIDDIDELPQINENINLFEVGTYPVVLIGGFDNNYNIITRDSKVTILERIYLDFDSWESIPDMTYGDDAYDLSQIDPYYDLLDYWSEDPNIISVSGHYLIIKNSGGTRIWAEPKPGVKEIYGNIGRGVYVAPAKLMITVEPVTFRHGEWFPDGDFKYVAEGLCYDDTLDDIKELPMPVTNVSMEDGPGVYDVWFVGGWDDNYLISTTSSTVTILPEEDLGVEGILDDDNEVEIYQLSGIKVFEGLYKEANLQPGLYIIRQNSKTYKVQIDNNNHY